MCPRERNNVAVVMCVCVCIDPALLASALRGLTPEQHTELRNTLDEVMMSVSSLRNEVAELRSGLREIVGTIVEDVR